MDTNKKTFNYSVLFGIVYGGLVIVALLWIWWPKSSRVFEGSEKYTKVNGNQKAIDIYSIKLKKLLSKGDVDELYEKLNVDYITNNNLTKDNYIKFLEERGFLANTIDIMSSTVNIQDNGVYVYRFMYKAGKLNNYVNVIETSPFEYTLSFEQDIIPNASNNNEQKAQSSKDKTTTFDNISYTVSKKTIRENGVNYVLKIVNNASEEVKYNFDNITNVSVILNNGKEAYLGGAVISPDDDIVSPNGELEKELFFAVSSSDQDKIVSLKIKNVKIGRKKKTVIINL